MFSKKLTYYPKPCKWLKFLLNIWWPILTVYYIFIFSQHFGSWHENSVFTFIPYLIVIVVLICSNLLARFLDKPAFISIFCSIGAVTCAKLIDLILVGTLTFPVSSFSESDSSENMITGIVNFSLDRVFVGAFYFQLFLFLVHLGITVATIIYFVKRKDLFLSGEKEIKELYQ